MVLLGIIRYSYCCILKHTVKLMIKVYYVCNTKVFQFQDKYVNYFFLCYGVAIESVIKIINDNNNVQQ